jgi:hypothetical protein
MGIGQKGPNSFIFSSMDDKEDDRQGPISIDDFLFP